MAGANRQPVWPQIAAVLALGAGGLSFLSLPACGSGTAADVAPSSKEQLLA